MGEDGKMKLKGDGKKIDLSKLSEDDLKKMGIDTENMTKEEIARKLKVEFSSLHKDAACLFLSMIMGHCVQSLD